LCEYEHVYPHKAAQKREREKEQQKTAIYSLAYIYIKPVVQQINVAEHMMGHFVSNQPILKKFPI